MVEISSNDGDKAEITNTQTHATKKKLEIKIERMGPRLMRHDKMEADKRNSL